MKEDDIRPAELMLENQKLRKEDALELINKKSDFVTVSCPACDSDNYQDVFEKEGFNFVICKDCESYFINPRPTPNMLNSFYENSRCLKHWNTLYSKTESARKNEIFIPRTNSVLEICKKFHVNNDTILDVGAGFGTFCEEIQSRQFFKKVIAVEPSNDLANACRQKGIDVIEKPIEDIDLDPVDVITNFELIEHLYYPKQFVQSCAKSLTKNGLFILTTPNIKGFDLATLGMLSTNIAGPNHLNYFNPDSLSKLLENCGFKVVEILTPGKLDAELVRKKFLEGELDPQKLPFLKQILIDKWEKLGSNFQQFLIDNGLSSHLWIVAQKT
jgi:2-polyprenyl-3-methyl-5-hydroxy-6-metoxy-1,4-benzoquinol methylase/ribosomal protein S27E